MIRIPAGVVAALALVVAGCSPGSDVVSVSDYDTVITLFSDREDFAAATTFAVADSVLHFVPEGQEDDISRDYDELILQRLRDNMSASGWAEVVDPDSTHAPDVVLQVGVTTSDNYVVEVWPPYWGFYPGWGYPGYGYGWGGAIVYSYSTGTILVGMLDLRDLDMTSETIPMIWLGALNGVLGAPVQGRIVEGIDQAFEQSPYLRK